MTPILYIAFGMIVAGTVVYIEGTDTDIETRLGRFATVMFYFLAWPFVLAAILITWIWDPN